MKFNFTKKLFIETINEIEKQHKYDKKCSNAFKILLPNDYVSFYDNSLLYNQLIKIIKIIMNDNNKDSWIDYYIWELEFGRKWEKGMISINEKDFKLKNAKDLWDLLNLK